jgi:hypothetical protein
MKLSYTELRMIEKLKKQQVSKRRWRVPLLIMHGLAFVGFCVLLVMISRFPSNGESEKVIVAAYYLPPAYFLLCVHSILFAQTINHWRDEPKTELLLRVLDELQRSET